MTAPRILRFMSLPLAIAFIAGFAAGIVGYRWWRVQPTTTTAAELAPEAHDLAIGYDLLQSVLADESQLDKILILKAVTFSRPPKPIQTLIRRISRAAQTRADELQRWAQIEPPYPSLPESNVEFGTTLRNNMKAWSRSRLTRRTSQFPVRVLVIQAQALAMLRAVALEIKQRDPNPERTAWLTEMAHEFAGLRADVLAQLALARVDTD